MAALLTNAVLGATANTTMTETSQVLISGDFSGGHACRIELAADSLNNGLVGDFNRDTQLSIAAKATTTIIATIIKDTSETGTACSIDVSVI